jgi:hypothetical protein
MRPEWREWASRPPEPKFKENEAQIVAEINEIADAPRASIESSGSFEEAERSIRTE